MERGWLCAAKLDGWPAESSADWANMTVNYIGVVFPTLAEQTIAASWAAVSW